MTITNDTTDLLTTTENATMLHEARWFAATVDPTHSGEIVVVIGRNDPIEFVDPAHVREAAVHLLVTADRYAQHIGRPADPNELRRHAAQMLSTADRLEVEKFTAEGRRVWDLRLPHDAKVGDRFLLVERVDHHYGDVNTTAFASHRAQPGDVWTASSSNNSKEVSWTFTALGYAELIDDHHVVEDGIVGRFVEVTD